jgi:hypothetical protein
MRKHITYALAFGVMLMSSIAAAQTPPAGTARRGPAERLHIGQRIREGVRAGQLTKPEVQRLRHRLTELRKEGQAMRGDGTLSPGERKQLRGEWRRTGRALFRMRHNEIRRERSAAN